MAHHSRFVQNQLEINDFFEKSQTQIYTFTELTVLFELHRDHWDLPKAMTIKKFIYELLEKTKMKSTNMEFPSNKFVRYVWGENANLYAIVATLHKKAYFSHLSAMYLHGLIATKPNEIFINVEQRERPKNETGLTQAGIDKAFKNHSRVTANKATVDGHTINLLNGKQTANLGVIKKEISGVGTCFLTNIERTLIDIAVRPVYSGGVKEVLNAYKGARGLISTELLAEYLLKIGHTYPYHQSIGFYLERARFPEETISIFEKMRKELIFYLDYRINNPKLSQKWNIIYPDVFDG